MFPLLDDNYVLYLCIVYHLFADRLQMLQITTTLLSYHWPIERAICPIISLHLRLELLQVLEVQMVLYAWSCLNAVYSMCICCILRSTGTIPV